MGWEGGVHGLGGGVWVERRGVGWEGCGLEGGCVGWEGGENFHKFGGQYNFTVENKNLHGAGGFGAGFAFSPWEVSSYAVLFRQCLGGTWYMMG